MVKVQEMRSGGRRHRREVDIGMFCLMGFIANELWQKMIGTNKVQEVSVLCTGRCMVLHDSYDL